MQFGNQNSAQEGKTIWMGDIDTWMDESTVSSYFQQTHAVVNVKIIKDKNTNLPAGYGFIEFATHEAAKQALQTYNNTQIPGTHKNFRLNWGVFSTGSKSQRNKQQSQLLPSAQSIQNQLALLQNDNGCSPTNLKVYVGELDRSVDDVTLFEFFSSKYKSVINAKVITDGTTKISKGYGFVKFSSQEEQMRALQEMNGALLKTKHIKISQAHAKQNQNDQAQLLNQLVSQIGLDQRPLQALLLNQQLYGMSDPTQLNPAAYQLAYLQQQQQQQQYLQMLQQQLGEPQIQQQLIAPQKPAASGSSQPRDLGKYQTQPGNQNYQQAEVGKQKSSDNPKSSRRNESAQQNYQSDFGQPSQSISKQSSGGYMGDHNKYLESGSGYQKSSQSEQSSYTKKQRNEALQKTLELNSMTDHEIHMYSTMIHKKYFTLNKDN